MTQIKPNNLIRATLLAVLFSISQAAHAVIVLPGDNNVPLSGTTLAANPDLAGVVLVDALRPFSIQDNSGTTILTGNVQDSVMRSNNTGELIFTPRLRNLVKPMDQAWIVGLQTTGYTGFATDIDFRTDGIGDVGPNSASRDITGNELFFRYDPNIIVPPEDALFLSVFTDATVFDRTGSITIFAQNDLGRIFSTTLVDTLTPAVPVPAAAWLFGSGLIGLIGIARRKKP